MSLQATPKFLHPVTIRHVSPSVGKTSNCHPGLSQEAAMRGLVRKTILAAAIAGSGIFVAMGAQAHDDDHWRDERWRDERWRREHRHQVEEHERWRHEPPRRVGYER